MNGNSYSYEIKLNNSLNFTRHNAMNTAFFLTPQSIQCTTIHGGWLPVDHANKDSGLSERTMLC